MWYNFCALNSVRLTPSNSLLVVKLLLNELNISVMINWITCEENGMNFIYKILKN